MLLRLPIILLATLVVGLCTAESAVEPVDPWAPSEPGPVLQSLAPLGFTVYRSEFDELTAPLVGEPYDEWLLRKALDAILREYHEAGYIHAHITEDDIAVNFLEGRDTGYYVRVRIHEGKIGEIRVEGLTRTRDKVIREQILLRVGERYRSQDAAESERILRRKPYVGRTKIRSALNRETHRVDVLVLVEDLWSFVPRGRVVNGGRGSLLNSLSDGDVGFRIDLRDSNFLGSGQIWRLRYQLHASDSFASGETRDTKGRSRIGAEFTEPNLFGTRWEMATLYQQRTDTEIDTWEFRLAHPFYSLFTKWSAELFATERGVVTPLFYEGTLLREWEHRIRRQSGIVTRSFGKPNNQIRLAFRMDHVKTDSDLIHSNPALERRIDPSFLAVPKGDERFEFSPESVPGNTRMLIGSTFTLHKVRFVQDRNVDRLGRTEDIAVGNTVSVSLGTGQRKLGNDHDELRPSVGVEIRTGAHAGSYVTVVGSLTAPYVYGNGRGGPNGFQDVTSALRARMLYRLGTDRIVAVRLAANAAHRTTGDFSMSLGNNTGVRGYRSRHDAGLRRVVLNVEGRQIVLEGSAFVLMATAFYDHGYAWWHRLHVGAPSRSIGAGIRLGVLKISGSPILRSDVAFTLDSKPREFRISGGTGQYF